MKQVLLLCCTIFFICIWAYEGHRSSREVSDLQKMMTYAKQYLNEDWHWMLKLGIPYASNSANSNDLNVQAEEIAKLFDIAPMEDTSSPSNPSSIVRSKQMDGMKIILRLTKLHKNQTYLTVTLAGRSDIPVEKAVAVQAQLTHTLKSIDIEPKWNLIVQGYTDPNLDWQTIQQDMEMYWKSDFQHIYSEANTVSATMYTPALQRSITEPINLQAAMHRHSETGDIRVTLGSPLITIEF